MAVIVDNLARTQAAANATKSKPKAVKVATTIAPLIQQSLLATSQVVESDSEGEVGHGRGRPLSRARPRRVTFAEEHLSHSVNDYYSSMRGEKQLSDRFVHVNPKHSIMIILWLVL